MVVQGVQGHYLLGLRILHMLVAEFNQPTSGRTMTMHRKLAVAFRDSSLFKIFQVAIAAMQQLQGRGRGAGANSNSGVMTEKAAWMALIADLKQRCAALCVWAACP